MNLTLATIKEIDIALGIIDEAKMHLKEQGIDQWQNGYPDYECLRNDILKKNGFFIISDGEVLGYMCIDFDGEPAYDTLQGTWNSKESYVVVHRLALSSKARGKGIVNEVFHLVYELSLEKKIYNFRVDTDADNKKCNIY